MIYDTIHTYVSVAVQILFGVIVYGLVITRNEMMVILIILKIIIKMHIVCIL